MTKLFTSPIAVLCILWLTGGDGEPVSWPRLNIHT